MNLFKRLIEILVYTNVWVALAVVALSDLTFLIIGRGDINLLLFVFFSTLLMYAYARWFDSPSREEERTSRLTDWTANNRWLYITSGIIGLAGTLYYITKLEQTTWLWLGVAAAISALYPLQFFGKAKDGLRNIAGIKLFVIGAVWAIVTTLLPAAQVHEPLDFEITLLTFQRFFFVVAITIPFDIRDLRIDSPSINTLPYKLGVKQARSLALLSLVLAEIAALVFYFSNLISAAELVGQIVAYEMASIFIYRSTPNKPDLYFSFGVESTSIILFLAVFIFNYFWP